VSEGSAVTSQQPIKIAIDRRPHTEAMLDGRLPPPRGLAVEFVEVQPISRAFRRTVRDQEFGISEMAIATHFIARAHGYPFIALPVFLARHYPHSAIQYSARAAVGSPDDLAGARIGSRSYTMTTAVWARGVLSWQYGVSLDKVTWVVADEEHVPGTALPPNVEYLPGADLKAMLSDGELRAGIGLAVRDETARPLWPDTAAVEQGWLAATGAVPINHTLVVREDLLADNSDLAQEIFAWFAESERLANGPAGTVPADRASAYDLTAANRTSLEVLLRLTREQLPGESGLSESVDDYFLPI
jgi:4,5-dihydroxyphthalate decarboxylase